MIVGHVLEFLIMIVGHVLEFLIMIVKHILEFLIMIVGHVLELFIMIVGHVLELFIMIVGHVRVLFIMNNTGRRQAFPYDSSFCQRCQNYASCDRIHDDFLGKLGCGEYSTCASSL